MKTYSLKVNDIQKKWYIVDAQGKVLGRLASQIAAILRGKNKPTFTPYMDMGDNSVVVVRFNTGQTKSLLVKYAGLVGA